MFRIGILTALLALGQTPSEPPRPPAKSPRVLIFGAEEVRGDPGRGSIRRYVSTLEQTPTEYGHQAVLTEYRDQVDSRSDAYTSFVERVEFEEIGDHADLLFSRRAGELFITVDGKAIGHRHDGAGASYFPSLPTEMEDPFFLLESFPGSIQLALDEWFARKGEGRDPQVLDGVSFAALSPRTRSVENYTISVTGRETLKPTRGSQVETTRLQITRAARDRSPRLERSLWVDTRGEIVKIELPRQLPAYRGERVTYNLRYRPRFGGTVTESVLLIIGNEGSHDALYSTNVLPGNAPTPAPAILIIDDAGKSGQRFIHRTRMEVVPHGVRVMTMTLPVAERQSFIRATRSALEYLQTRPGVDPKRIFLFTAGFATPVAEDFLDQGAFAGWIAANGLYMRHSQVDIRTVVRNAGIPVLLVYGEVGEDDEKVARRRELAQELARITEAGDIEIVPLSEVDQNMRLVSDDASLTESPAPGYYRALSRWLRKHALGR